jgi:hypothetical protein
VEARDSTDLRSDQASDNRPANSDAAEIGRIVRNGSRGCRDGHFELFPDCLPQELSSDDWFRTVDCAVSSQALHSRARPNFSREAETPLNQSCEKVLVRPVRRAAYDERIESPRMRYPIDHLQGEHYSAAGTVKTVGVVPAFCHDCWSGRADSVQPHRY